MPLHQVPHRRPIWQRAQGQGVSPALWVLRTETQNLCADNLSTNPADDRGACWGGGEAQEKNTPAHPYPRWGTGRGTLPEDSTPHPTPPLGRNERSGQH